MTSPDSESSAFDYVAAQEMGRTWWVAHRKDQLRIEVLRAAAELTAMKTGRVIMQRDGYRRIYHVDLAINRLRREVRILNVAYGLSRGRKWGQIERNHPDGDERLAADVQRTLKLYCFIP